MITPQNVLDSLNEVLATRGAPGLLAGTRAPIQDPGRMGGEYEARLHSPLSGSKCVGNEWRVNAPIHSLPFYLKATFTPFHRNPNFRFQ